MLTVYPDSLLYEEIQNGNWKEESETEKYREMRTLAEHLEIPTVLRRWGRRMHFRCGMHCLTTKNGCWYFG